MDKQAVNLSSCIFGVLPCKIAALYTTVLTKISYVFSKNKHCVSLEMLPIIHNRKQTWSFRRIICGPRNVTDDKPITGMATCKKEFINLPVTFRQTCFIAKALETPPPIQPHWSRTSTKRAVSTQYSPWVAQLSTHNCCSTFSHAINTPSVDRSPDPMVQYLYSTATFFLGTSKSHFKVCSQ